MSIISVPQQAWYNTGELKLNLPDDWEVQVCHMSGYNRPALKSAEINTALDKPIDTLTIRELARGKNEVVIIFDDQTRITRPAPIVPFILEELHEAGIADDNIRFICALGMHGAMYRSDFVKKLGENIVAKYRVYNHNPFAPGVFVGTTELFKTPVYINEEVMLCDLKIAITGCVPHPGAGFGGGGKIVLPGVASYETIKWHHSRPVRPSEEQEKAGTRMGRIDDNGFREDLDQAADLAKIDFGITAIVNEWGDSVSIYAGTLRASHTRAVEEARTHYRTPKVTGMDIVISNTYAKVNEANIGLDGAVPAIKNSGGDIVLIANAPEGQITHYLGSPFGKIIWAKRPSRSGLSENVNNLIVYSEFPHPGSSWFNEDKRILYMSKWEDIISFLKKSHPAGTKVAVLPDATNQYFA
jgi:nickel-dependent lactate racemase